MAPGPTPPAAGLELGVVDVEVLRLITSTTLQSLLDKIIGPKTLVLDPTLAGPLGLVTQVGLLKVRVEAQALFCPRPLAHFAPRKFGRDPGCPTRR